MTTTTRQLPLSAAQLDDLRALRAEAPGTITQKLLARSRRDLLRGDKSLLIVAADHPARGAMGVGDDPMAMADRGELLGRLALALSHPGVDGVLATPDIIDDLAALDLLDDKVVVGSMNRGGLQRASFEMDDRFTGYTIEGIQRAGLDMAKTLVRVNLQDAGSVATLEAMAVAVDQAVAARIPVLLEPFISRWQDGRIVNDLSWQAVAASVGISAALGSSSEYSWMKLPVVDEMERVMAATTLPTMLLGGDTAAAPDETYRRWEAALALPGVRGLSVGRALLYPADDDVSQAIDIAAHLVHPDATF